MVRTVSAQCSPKIGKMIAANERQPAKKISVQENIELWKTMAKTHKGENNGKTMNSNNKLKFIKLNICQLRFLAVFCILSPNTLRRVTNDCETFLNEIR